MIQLVRNYLEGKYASPKTHPVTCANPAPWKIVQMKVEYGYDGLENMIKVFIRGEESMWFRADQCYILTQEDVQEMGS